MENSIPKFFFHCEIDGKPCAQPRPRLARGGHIYDPSMREKERIRNEISRQWKQSILWRDSDWEERFKACKEFIVEMNFVFFRGYCSEKERNRRNWGFSPYTKKPDLDNLSKLYLDCLNELVVKDDRFITKLSVGKRYGEYEKTEIKITGVFMNEEDLNNREVISDFSMEEVEFLADAGRDLGFFLQEERSRLDENSLKNILIGIAKFWKKFRNIIFLEDKKKEIDSGRIS